MAAANTLLHILYSLSALSSQKPSADENGNLPVTSNSCLKDFTTFVPLHYEPEENCPPGEVWSECDANCQHDCSNVGQEIICPRMCVPGCICDDPGTVRGPDGKCIPPPLCPASPKEENCPPGEVWSECDADCQHDCSNVGQEIICPRMCVPGCICDDPGTVRGPDGKCIPPPLCPASPKEENCPPGEVWSDCDAGCQHNCSNVGQEIICPRMCVPGCICDDPGTVRGPDGKCIPPPLCPASPEVFAGQEEECPPGEEWSDCDAGCQHDCSNVGQEIICPRMCVPGCVCDDPGTVRGPEGNCIPPPLCPASSKGTKICPDAMSCLRYCRDTGNRYGFCDGDRSEKCKCIK